MTAPRIRSIDQTNFIRSKLYQGNKSSLRRYAELVVGHFAIGKLIKYELLTTLLGPLPGSLGLVLRRLFYPMLFRKVGRGVVFGRNLVIRNADRISLGDRVILDDDVVLDARGSGEEGIWIGDEVIANRGAMILSKLGAIRIGSHSDIGIGTLIVAQGGIDIGDMVSLAGGCKVGGGLFQTVRHQQPDGTFDANDFKSRGQLRLSKGPVSIGDRCLIGSHAMVLDGAQVGRDAIIGPGAIVMQHIPESTVATQHQRLVLLPRQDVSDSPSYSLPEAETARLEPSAPPRSMSEAVAADQSSGVVAIVLSAIDELNEMRPAGEQISKDTSTPLFGPAGLLDSMELVNLIVLTEQKIQQQFGTSINLASEKSLSGGASHFATIESFVDHIATLLPETTSV